MNKSTESLCLSSITIFKIEAVEVLNNFILFVCFFLTKQQSQPQQVI